MKVMLLAAGQGTRLRPLTATCPKPMIPIAGQPMLTHVIRLLVKHGFDQIVINLHHLPAQIKDYFGQGEGFNAQITYSFEKELLGTAGAVHRLAAFFDQPFLVYYADNLCNVDLSALWRCHQSSDAPATVGLVRMDDPKGRGIVQLKGDGRITAFIEKPRPDQVFTDFYINGGIYALDPGILPLIPRSGNDFAHDLFPFMLSRGLSIRGHLLDGQLLSTDTPERYQHAQNQVASGAFALP